MTEMSQRKVKPRT